ncbi:MAG: hypothetical protein IIV01_04430 [Bacteroidaceae bacterium]|jgi:hypothetical protein|nr:hypothetical protein [Bacteroidaceae bacterium]MEE0985746.1 hypothetical protein [Bacteroidaceae bacterium]
MNIFKLFSKKKKEEKSTEEIENLMLLLRVYFQATIAAQTGFNNIKVLNDLRFFKQTYHIATLNNKIGLSEKKQCQKMLQSIYGFSDRFFSEIDSSMKKSCRTIQDFQPYMLKYQDFTQNILMLIPNLVGRKLAVLRFFPKLMKESINKSIHKTLTQTDWKDPSTRIAAIAVRKEQTSLRYSEAWICEFVNTIIPLGLKSQGAQNEEQA